MYTENILAIRGMAGDEDANAIMFIIDVNDGIDLKQAIRDAATEFCNTDDGRRIYCNINCYNFNWFDLDSFPIPENICMKHGFRLRKVISAKSNYIVNADELLVYERNVHVPNEEE